MPDKDLPKGDEGLLLMAFRVEDEHLIIKFHEPTAWLALHKEDADAMIAKLQELRKKML